LKFQCGRHIEMSMLSAAAAALKVQCMVRHTHIVHHGEDVRPAAYIVDVRTRRKHSLCVLIAIMRMPVHCSVSQALINYMLASVTNSMILVVSCRTIVPNV